MSSRKQINNYLRINPELASWLKTKPDIVKKIKENPAEWDAILIAWKKQQDKKANLQKVGKTYRQLVDQVQELNLLLQRVDDLVSNVKNMSKQQIDGVNNQETEKHSSFIASDS